MLEDLRRAREQAELRVLELEREVDALQQQLQLAQQQPRIHTPRPAPQLDALATATELQQLVNALPTLQWGLAQTIQYLEPFAADQAMLAAHVRQLTLLRNVLERLGQFAKT
jgi:hypothetical protein